MSLFLWMFLVFLTGLCGFFISLYLSIPCGSSCYSPVVVIRLFSSRVVVSSPPLPFSPVEIISNISIVFSFTSIIF